MSRRKLTVSMRILVAIFIVVVAVTPVILFSLSSNVEKAIENVVRPWHDATAEIAAQTISSRFDSIDFLLREFIFHVKDMKENSNDADAQLFRNCIGAFSRHATECIVSGNENATVNETHNSSTTVAPTSAPVAPEPGDVACKPMCEVLLPFAHSTLRRVIETAGHEEGLTENDTIVRLAMWKLSVNNVTNRSNHFVEVPTFCTFVWANSTASIEDTTIPLLKLTRSAALQLFLFDEDADVDDGNDGNSTNGKRFGEVGGRWMPLRTANPPSSKMKSQTRQCWPEWEDASWKFVSSIEYVAVLNASLEERLAFGLLSSNASTGIGQSNNCGRTLMGNWNHDPVFASTVSSGSQLVIVDPVWRNTTDSIIEIDMSLTHCCCPAVNPFLETLLGLILSEDPCVPGGDFSTLIYDDSLLQQHLYSSANDKPDEHASYVLDDQVYVSYLSLLLGSEFGKEQFTLLLTTGPQDVVDEVRRSDVTSVIVGVSFSAAAVVTIMFLLHYVFHPLKVVGSLLRACADINLVKLEVMSPSNIAEIFDIQANVDMIIQRMKQYGKYMPDKSQLSTILSQQAELKGFDETGIGLDASCIGGAGAIPQSVTVDVEYRSRRRPTLQRTIEDLNKRCTFLLKYTASDNIHEAIMEQVRKRLHERVGETLEMRSKPKTDESTQRVNSDECTILYSTHDVLHAIEDSNDGMLHLIVIKTAQKNWSPYLLVLVSVADVAMVAFATRTWLVGDDKTISEMAIAVALLLLTKLVCNLSACVALHRNIVKKFDSFALWVQDASLEVSFSIVCGSFSVCNLWLLFSHTRFSRKLRFNAPYQESFGRDIVQYAAAGYISGDVVPLIIISYTVITIPTAMGIAPILAMTSTGLSIVLYLCQSVLHRSRPNSPDKIREDAENEKESEVNAAAPQVVPSSRKEDEAKKESVGYLGLARRNATVLLVALCDTESHIESMNTVEIQLLLSNYFSYVFAQANHFHGLVLRLSGTEVTVGFNCHHFVPNHLLAAYQCFNAIEDDLNSHLTQWCDDNHVKPKLCGALVSGGGCIVGYAGTQETRNFQQVGNTAIVLEILRRMSMFYRGRLCVRDSTGTHLDTDYHAAANTRKILGNLSFASPLSKERSSFALRELDVVQVPTSVILDDVPHLRIVEVLRDIPTEQLNASRASFSPMTSFNASTLLLKDYVVKYVDYPMRVAHQWAGKAQPPRCITPLGIDTYPQELDLASELHDDPALQQRGRPAFDAPHPLLRTLFQKTSYSVTFTDN